MLPCWDAEGIGFEVAAADRAAHVVLLSAERLGMLSIMRRVGCAKATVWRWQDDSWQQRR
jgi:hypothetical protein